MLIALFFLGVVAERVAGSCESAVALAAGEVEHHGTDHSDEQNCHCTCHHTFVTHEPTVDLRAAAVLDFAFEAERAEAPPEAIPLGIDHPPQLG